MKSFFNRLVTPPHFEDEDKNTRAAFLYTVSLALMGVFVVSAVVIAFTEFAQATLLLLGTLILVLTIALILLRRGNLTVSGIVITSLSWVSLTIQAYTASGVHDVIVIGYLAIVLFANLVFNLFAALMTLGFSLIAIWVFAFSEANGSLIVSLENPIAIARDLTIIYVIIALLVYFIGTTLQKNVTRLRKNNIELEKLQVELEQKAEERNMEFEKKTKQLNVAAEISRQSTQVKDLPTLLSNIVNLISLRFGYYHAGIFLHAENSDYVVLRAASSEGGMRMLERDYRLRIGIEGIVGYVAEQKQGRIIQDLGPAGAFNEDADLPNTRSEIALPLIAQHRLIGVLNIHSTEPNAFSENDIEIFQAMSDQIAVAIENIRLLAETKLAVSQLENLAKNMSAEGWQAQLRKKPVYRYTALGVSPVTAEGTKSLKAKDFSVPLVVRGQRIGQINLKRKIDQPNWTDYEQNLAAEVAGQIALALEAARLVEESQRRAAWEHKIADATSKIGTSPDLDAIMRATVESLGSTLGDTSIELRLVTSSQA